MARQAEASTSYKVKIHLNNGYTLDVAIKRQRAALEEIMAGGLSMEDDRTLISYALNTKKVEEARLASGFYANVTHKLNLTPMQALDAYSLRDEQEKYFEQQRGPLGCDRQRCHVIIPKVYMEVNCPEEVFLFIT